MFPNVRLPQFAFNLEEHHGRLTHREPDNVGGVVMVQHKFHTHHEYASYCGRA